MATKRKTTKKRPAARRSGRKPTKAEQQSRKQLSAVVLFALGILLLCFAAIPGANFWNAVHNAIRGVFSWGAFLVGPVIIYTAVMIALDRSSFSLSGRVVASCFLILLLSAAIQVFSRQTAEGGFPEMVRELYMSGMQLTGGGALGVAGVGLARLLGTVGARIVVLLLIFVFLMIVSGGTLAGLFRGAAKPVKKLEEAYASASENRAARPSAPAEPAQPKFNIDVPLEDAKPARGKLPNTAPAQPEVLNPRLPPETEAAREKLLNAAAAASTHRGRAYDFDSEPDKPAEPEKPQEKGPTLDDLINKAVSGSEMVGGPAIRTSSGRLGFGGEHAEAPAPVTDDAPQDPKAYAFPDIDLLDPVDQTDHGDTTTELKANADRLVDTLRSFGVQTRVVNIARGPAVTRYELQPSAGVKISRITNLADDIALNLAAAGVRIEAPIPNKAAIGIEVPNKTVSKVQLREIIDSDTFEKARSTLTVALGKDISGSLVVCDIAEMPHLLIAGTTGSGKSVCINALIVSLLYKASPEQLKLIMIDPKVVELSGYNGIPHLLVPVVTEPRKAAGALGSAVGEMLRRYKLFADAGARDLKGYNELASQGAFAPMPQVVIIVDELADLMMSAPKDVEDHICRLAQMGRAAGIHLVVATQRPSVDVITGLIKANIRSRISFAVASQVDSRTILDMGGAEKLLGKGDMLYFPIGTAKPVRVQGCFVTDAEVERVIGFIREESAAQNYDEDFMNEIEKQASMVKGKSGASGPSGAEEEGDSDEMLDAAIECVVEAGIASTSLLQRRLKLGYARAARIIDEMESRGIVGPFEGSKPRQVLLSKDRYYEMKLNRDAQNE